MLTQYSYYAEAKAAGHCNLHTVSTRTGPTSQLRYRIPTGPKSIAVFAVIMYREERKAIRSELGSKEAQSRRI
jgi:hypothetical protein